MGGLINEVAPVSDIQPSYAPAGKSLASVTILGDRPESDAQLAELARKELEVMFPKASVNLWRFLRAYRVRYAQFDQPNGVFGSLPHNATDVEGLYFAGEFTTNSSIDGAIQSGATCGNLLARKLSLVPA
jgi:phytoene dehydrogenase-like protein